MAYDAAVDGDQFLITAALTLDIGTAQPTLLDGFQMRGGE
jgi:hypothetical protein